MNQTLRDLGEREIIKTILPGCVDGVGNDCAVLRLLDHDLLLTTDPVPQPAASFVTDDPDLYWLGWLLVTINASDLAAAGAKPLAFVASINAPPDLAVDHLEQLLSGIADSCKAQDLSYVGGDLGEGDVVSAVGTALGYCDRDRAITRAGAQPGDLLVSIGQGGIFWRDVFSIRYRSAEPDRLTSPVFRPKEVDPENWTIC